MLVVGALLDLFWLSSEAPSSDSSADAFGHVTLDTQLCFSGAGSVSSVQLHCTSHVLSGTWPLFLSLRPKDGMLWEVRKMSKVLRASGGALAHLLLK